MLAGRPEGYLGAPGTLWKAWEPNFLAGCGRGVPLVCAAWLPALPSGIKDSMGYKRHTEYHPAGTWQTKPEISYIPAGHERRDGHSARLRNWTSSDASFDEGYRVLGGVSTNNSASLRLLVVNSSPPVELIPTSNFHEFPA